jgi:hypothetical protein
MKTHTPGPWWFCEDLDGVFMIGQGDIGIAAAHPPKLREGEKMGLFDPGDPRANARLIAAAPELLAAAQAMLAVCYDLERNDETLAAVKKTMIAIAKATGENP